jgi:hypothetical protein
VIRSCTSSIPTLPPHLVQVHETASPHRALRLGIHRVAPPGVLGDPLFVLPHCARRINTALRPSRRDRHAPARLVPSCCWPRSGLARLTLSVRPASLFWCMLSTASAASLATAYSTNPNPRWAASSSPTPQSDQLLAMGMKQETHAWSGHAGSGRRRCRQRAGRRCRARSG